jgi:Bacterial archaeo-eukaryotic release factor family 7
MSAQIMRRNGEMNSQKAELGALRGFQLEYQRRKGISMNTISRDDLRQLATMDGEYVVSIYMPARVGADSRQNPVRFNNLLRAAGQKMLDRKIGEPAVQKMTVSARTLLNQPDLWQELTRGLAVFVSRDSVRAWPLPFACEEKCVVGAHVYLLPLLSWGTNDAPYFVLAVSRNAVRLLEGTRARIQQVALPGLPANLSDALNYDVRQGTVQMHSGTPRLSGKEGAVFHGQGGEVDVAKQELTSFFREIDRAVSDYLQLRSEPLIFAGVDYLFPIYQSVNSYPNLASTPITGNPDSLIASELRVRAWPLVEAFVRGRNWADAEKYWNSVAHGRTSNRMDEVLAAAHAGAVEMLFIARSARQLGTFAPDSGKVQYHDTPQPNSEDLVNLAATFVLRTGGAVETVLSGNVPGGGPMAAVMRYPFAPAFAPAAQFNGAHSKV